MKPELAFKDDFVAVLQRLAKEPSTGKAAGHDETLSVSRDVRRRHPG